MKRRGKGRRIFALGAIVLTLTLAARGQSELFGRILDQVACETDATQSYALYVPSNYSKEKKWPVIFCFDASARGRVPVERLQAAAEKYGYVVAGSLNSRNGPWTANAAAAQAMARDVSMHFSLDPQRIYTTGVSGGARVATALALSGMAKGVIACAAGFPVLPEGIPASVPFLFFGTAGTEDFNHAELQRLDGDLEERKAVHRIVFFNGGHEWASAELMTQAVEWLELQAMRAGKQPRDDAFVQAILRLRVAALPAQPALERWKELKSLAADFNGLAEIASFAREAKELGASLEVKEQLKAERALAAREEALLADLGEAATGTPAERKKIAAKVRQKADAPQDSAERQMARRVIASFVSMTRETTRGMFEDHEYSQAVGYFELALALRPAQPRTLFDLSRAHALDGNKKRALESLAQAADAGFSDVARVEAEPAFEKFRADPEFQKSLARIRDEKDNPTVHLPPMRVSAALAAVELRLFYLPNAGDGAKPLSFLRVETVRPNSTAALAGIAEGMEITAIQGTRIRGLYDADLNDLTMRSVQNEIVLTVRNSSGSPEREMHVPVRRPTTGPDAPQGKP